MLLPKDQVLITESQLSPVVIICAIVFIIIAFLSVLGRTFTKIAVLRSFGLDDGLIFAGLILSCAQTAAVIVASAYGIGQHWNVLEFSAKITTEKSIYAAALLYIASQCFAKLSVLAFVLDLSPRRDYRKISLVIAASILAWAIASEFAAAFQCSLPYVWEPLSSQSCFNLRIFWTCFATLNILSDAMLIVWPTVIVSHIQTTWKRKVFVISCFASRLLTIAAIIAQIIYINRIEVAEDWTYSSWQSVTITQLVQALSISTACIPYMKPFLESLESGMMRSDDLRRRRQGSKGTYGLQSSSRNGSIPLGNSQHRSIPPPLVLDSLRNMADTANSTEVQADSNGGDHDSISSQAKIIKQTSSFAVYNEPRLHIK